MIDATGRYRYVLRRAWDTSKTAVLWIMLNPSTADATTDDPTIRRCLAFAKAWGCGEMTVVNLFALRATDPRALRIHPAMFNQTSYLDVVGPDNDEHLLREAEVHEMIVAAWGSHGTLHNRGDDVRELLCGEAMWTLGLTKSGQPRHPLYVRGDVKPQPWRRSAPQEKPEP